jgi:hypothetical protein
MPFLGLAMSQIQYDLNNFGSFSVLQFGNQEGPGPLDCVWNHGAVFTITAGLLKNPAVFVRGIHNKGDQFLRFISDN